MLDNTQRERIADQVAFMLIGDRYALVPLMGLRHAIRIASDPVPRTYALRALQYCERSAWIENPPLLINMLQVLTRLDAFFDAVLTEVQRRAPAVFHVDGEPWDTCQVALEMPFLNREISRKAIRQFTEPLLDPATAAPTRPSPARVLVVNGGPGSGKTFTLDYIRYLAVVDGNHHGVAYVDAAKQVSAHFGPADLVRSLADQISPGAGGFPEPGSQRADRWLLELTIWLAKVASSTQKEFWYLILDNFDDARIPQDTRAVIELLATGLAGKAKISWETPDAAMGPPLRLVLLRYPQPLDIENPLLIEPDRVVREHIDPVRPEDLRKHFQRYFAYRGWPIDAATLDRIVHRVAEAAARMPPGKSAAPLRTQTFAALVRQVSASLEQLYARQGGLDG